jgi:hypothetical protein
MSGSNTLTDQVMIRAIAKRLANPSAVLTAAEELRFGSFLGTATSSGTDATGFPAADGGDVNGWNSLTRTNWFNGRFLTAEALRRQDAYFDYRARLDAQALMPGIAYGLGLSANGINATPYAREKNRQGGVRTNTPIVLQPGLAFDMIGRPILVPANFSFTLDQLIALQKSAPRRVVGGGTEFAPCLCLAPDPGGATGGSQAPRPGPYILIIEAAEKASGDAKVYGSVCGDSQPVTCQGDAWTSGFGLSLVRFPVDVPDDEPLRSPWDLRGILSAYFFDVFEHSLIKRWDPSFATDHGFCEGSSPGRRDTGAIALAMVYLGTDATALWVDPWLPRRSIVATPGEDWHRTKFGAPPRAAAWARIHQFQCMLADSLAVAPLVNDNEFSPLNLLTRGFRHIPPIGFLPIDPAQAARTADRQQSDTGSAALDKVLNAGGAQAGIVSGYVAAAQLQARRYFRATNVLAYTTVALHDDDILEDLSNTFDKDPVQLDVPPQPDAAIERLVASLTKSAGKTAGWLLDLEVAILEVGLDDLVNRRIEIVKLVVPLQGLVRPHPILGVVAQDAQDQAASWGASVDPTADARGAVGLAQQFGLQMLPRHFVVYVKQRMVLLEAIFVGLEMVKYVLLAASQANGAKDQTASYATTEQMRAAYQAQPQQKRMVAAAALQHPATQLVLARALPLVAPDLAVSSRTTTFQAQVEAQDAALVASIPDATVRRQAAVDRVADSYATVYPGFQVVQVLAATQSPEQTEAAVQSIGLAAGATDVLAVAPSATAEDASLKDGTPVFATADSALLYAQMRAATAEQPVTALVPKAPAGITVGDVLSKSPADATVLLGGASAYKSFLGAYAAGVKTSVDATRGVAVAPPAGVADKLQAAVKANDGDVAKAVETVRAAAGDDAGTVAYLTHAATVANVLGPARAATVGRKLFNLG